MKEIMALCIGGPLDGKTRPVGYHLFMETPIPPPRQSVMDISVGEMGAQIPLAHAHYEREVFTANGERFYFWRLAEMPVSEMLRQLIAGYKPANR